VWGAAHAAPPGPRQEVSDLFARTAESSRKTSRMFGVAAEKVMSTVERTLKKQQHKLLKKTSSLNFPVRIKS